MPWTNTGYSVVCREHACDTAYVRTVCDVVDTHMREERRERKLRKKKRKRLIESARGCRKCRFSSVCVYTDCLRGGVVYGDNDWEKTRSSIYPMP